MELAQRRSDSSFTLAADSHSKSVANNRTGFFAARRGLYSEAGMMPPTATVRMSLLPRDRGRRWPEAG